MGKINDTFYEKSCVTGFYVDETNSEAGPVVRWTSNDRIPFDDMLDRFLMDGLITPLQMVNSMTQRDVEVGALIAEYRANYTPPDAEQRSEMRAAFGEGVTVVDVFSGYKTRT
jgi:hypothetical protein